MAYKVLVADDEMEIRELLKIYLEKDGYQVMEAGDGIEALEMIRKYEPDIAMIDIMMPRSDGFHLLKKIREFSNLPVIILSAKILDSDKILGLDLGADDYLAKPVNPLEAVARVNAQLRRFYKLGAKSEIVDKIIVKDLVLDVESCALYKMDELIELTSIQYKIMYLFMTNPGKVFTKQQIFEIGWGEDYIIDDNSIMVCISKLRNKLSDDGNQYIKTIRGLGYRLERT